MHAPVKKNTVNSTGNSKVCGVLNHAAWLLA